MSAHYKAGSFIESVGARAAVLSCGVVPPKAVIESASAGSARRESIAYLREKAVCGNGGCRLLRDSGFICDTFAAPQISGHRFALAQKTMRGASAALLSVLLHGSTAFSISGEHKGIATNAVRRMPSPIAQFGTGNYDPDKMPNRGLTGILSPIAGNVRVLGF